MLKLLSYLKKTPISVLVIILLLCVQAAADLELPNYTSKIVNVGIQQSGIENSSPEVIRKTSMDDLLLFTKEDENILQYYTYISKNDLSIEEYNSYKNKYPIIEKENLYIKNKLNKYDQKQLDELISKPIMELSLISNNEMENYVKSQILQEMPEEQKTVFMQVPLIDIIRNMPEQNVNIMLVQLDQKINEYPGTMLEQAAISAVKKEYEAIGMNIDGLQNSYIIKSGLQMLGIALISMVSAVIIMLLSARVAANLGKTLREKVFEKVLSFSTKEFTEFSTASLITRSTNDIQQIQQLLTMLFRVVIYAPIIGIGGVIRVFQSSNSSMAWIIGFAVLCVIAIVLILFIFVIPKFKKLQELIDRLNQVSREILTGIPVIRAFNTEKREEARFEKSNSNLTKVNIFVNRALSIMMPALMFVMNGIMILIIWVGGHNVDAGVMQVGDMMAFIQYTMQIIISFLFISMTSIILPRATVSARRINEVIESDISIKEMESPKEFQEDKKGIVEFKNVSFRYPDADTEMLVDISFKAEPGKTTAIIGGTGSGKSTIINLIPRFYDATNGEIFIDGVNIKEVSIKELRKKIGFVPQKGLLFSGTIESNIKYGDPQISDEQMKKAAKIAQATDFIESKPKKYKEEIAQGGNNISGGQRQRLSIARAIAINPEIFIFDDSFSALDLKTDKLLREALKEETENKTVIIVAQRISTILNAEQIIVLDEGKIVGKGSHRELINTCEVYKQIALSQLSKEELENGK